MLKIKYISLFLFFIFNAACHPKPKQNISTDLNIAMKTAVQEILGKKYKTIPNSSRELVLCLTKNKIKSEVMHTLHVVVWDSVSGTIIFQKGYPGGKVRWYDRDHLEVVQIPGIVRNDEQPRPFLIDVHTGKKQQLNSLHK